MRALPCLAAALVLTSCAASVPPVGRLSGGCAEQYRVCTRSLGDEEYCEEQRGACRTANAAAREQSTKKQRGYEEFKRQGGSR